MVSWTSIGSLIAYFKARQGARFYVKLYCCFYLPGLPVSLIQQKYDEKMDKLFGSANSFLVRVVLSMVVKISLLLFMPFVPDMFSIENVTGPATPPPHHPTSPPPWQPGNLMTLATWQPDNLTTRQPTTHTQVPNVILLCMILIGSFSWLCHGTASMLCSMFPPSSMAYMQTGFRTPEIYTVIILSILGLNSSASEVTNTNTNTITNTINNNTTTTTNTTVATTTTTAATATTATTILHHTILHYTTLRCHLPAPTPPPLPPPPPG